MSLIIEKTFAAEEAALPEILGWVEEQSMELLPMGLAMKLQLAAEEAIVNVVHYAYAADAAERPLTLRFGQEDTGIFYLELEDRGTAFNPLAGIKVDPTQDLESRKPGGWGRELIVKMTTTASYVYRDGANVLRMAEDPATAAAFPDLPE